MREGFEVPKLPKDVCYKAKECNIWIKLTRGIWSHVRDPYYYAEQISYNSQFVDYQVEALIKDLEKYFDPVPEQQWKDVKNNAVKIILGTNE